MQYCRARLFFGRGASSVRELQQQCRQVWCLRSSPGFAGREVSFRFALCDKAKGQLDARPLQMVKLGAEGWVLLQVATLGLKLSLWDKTEKALSLLSQVASSLTYPAKR